MRPKNLLSDSFFPILLVLIALGFFFSGMTISRDKLEIPSTSPTPDQPKESFKEENTSPAPTENPASQIEISYSITAEPAVIDAPLFQATSLQDEIPNPGPTNTLPPFCPEDNLNGTHNECTNSCNGTVKTDGNETCKTRYSNSLLVCCTASQKTCKPDKSCNWKNNTNGLPNGLNSECFACGGWCSRQGIRDFDPGKCVNATN